VHGSTGGSSEMFNSWISNCTLGNWHYVSFQVTITTALTNDLWILIFDVLNANERIRFSDFQIEKKSYSTEFTVGTRLSTIRDNSGFFNDSEIVNLNGYGYKVDHIDQYGTWVKIFNHNSQNNANLFASDAEAAYNDPGNQNSNKFSILNQIPNFIRSDNKYKFKLQYPDVGLGIRNIWFQTSNPNTSLVSGYQAISIENSGQLWGGLERTNLSGGTTATYIDGSVNNGNWWFSIGQKVSFTGGNPGPGVTVNNTSLYMCIEDTKFIKNYPKWTSDSKIGTGNYIFPGSSTKFINIPTSIIGTSEGTISAWIKTSVNHRGAILGWGDGGTSNWGTFEIGPSTGAVADEFLTYVNLGANNLSFVARDLSTSNSFLLSDGNWHHVVVRISDSEKAMFLDGVKLTNYNFNPGNQSTVNGFMKTGNNTIIKVGDSTYNGGHIPFNGNIDDIRIYSTALSDKDILDLYNTKAEIEQSGVLYARDFLSNAEETVNLLYNSNLAECKILLPIVQHFAIDSASANNYLSPDRPDVTRITRMSGVTSQYINIAIQMQENAVIGSFYTISYDYKLLSNTTSVFSDIPTIYGNDYKTPNSGNYATDQSFQRINLGNGWFKHITTYKATYAGKNYARFNIYANYDIYIDNIQYEQKAYATPFVSTFRPAIELPTGVQFGADEIHETGIANFEDFSTVGITDGLVGYWPLNNNLRDYSGSKYDGSNSGATFDGESTYFNGSSFLTVPYGDSINPSTNPHSFSLMIKKTAATDTIFFSTSQTGDVNARLYLRSDINNGLDFGIRNFGTGGTINENSLPLNEWHHIIITMDGSNARLYLDSNLIETQSYTSYVFNTDIELGYHDGYY
jgi:hypothetical protein